jgi:hypothetical protein
MIHAVEVTLTAVAIPFCASVRVPVVVEPASVIVSVVIAIEQPVAFVAMNVTAVPISYATDAFAGIVMVLLAPVS